MEWDLMGFTHPPANIEPEKCPIFRKATFQPRTHGRVYVGGWCNFCKTGNWHAHDANYTTIVCHARTTIRGAMTVTQTCGRGMAV